MNRKVCVVTAARSEYGLLRWTIDEIQNDSELELQLVVTGAHLSEEHGLTVSDIDGDGYPIAARVDMGVDASGRKEIVRSMGRCMAGMADAFESLSPDLIVVLGDRYELLSVCSAALLMNIPIVHISGGDITLGAIDNEIRNAVTMMASLHFPGVEDSAENIRRMRNTSNDIYAVGEPGLDNFRRLELWDRNRLSDNIGFSSKSNWVLLSLHPETQRSLDYNLEMARNIISLLDRQENISVIITQANADFGGEQINSYFKSVVSENSAKYKLFPSLGQLRYLSLMQECVCMIGNSSSGIVEAPCVGLPVINVGGRQEGRHLCANVIQTNSEESGLNYAWDKADQMSKSQKIIDNYYGDGKTARRIVEKIKIFFDGIKK